MHLDDWLSDLRVADAARRLHRVGALLDHLLPPFAESWRQRAPERADDDLTEARQVIVALRSAPVEVALASAEACEALAQHVGESAQALEGDGAGVLHGFTALLAAAAREAARPEASEALDEVLVGLPLLAESHPGFEEALRSALGRV
jgi:hypothetical protein